MNKLESYSLSGNDMRSAIQGIRIVEYPKLATVDDIFDVFDSDGRCVLFFITSEQGVNMVGHWLCIFYDQEQNTINHFDSYGIYPDDEEEYLSKNIGIKLKENGPLLMPLLQKANEEKGTKIFYNNVKIQQMKADVDTCGRYVIARLIHKNLSNQQFIQFLNQLKTEYNVKTYDDAVTQYTYNIIDK